MFVAMCDEHVSVRVCMHVWVGRVMYSQLLRRYCCVYVYIHIYTYRHVYIHECGLTVIMPLLLRVCMYAYIYI